MAWLLLVLWVGALPGGARELDDVYRLRGRFRVVDAPGLKIYYPIAVEPVLPRVIDELQQARARIRAGFPEIDAYQVPVILSDHDDRSTGRLDLTLDLVQMGLFEETRSLSTRGYTLAERFALRLANLLINRRLGSARPAIKRRVGLLITPPWLIEGLAMHLALPPDSRLFSRLESLCASGRTIRQETLDTYLDREGVDQENLRFFARGLVDSWVEETGSGSIDVFLRAMGRNPLAFGSAFHSAFGRDLGPAIGHGTEVLRQRCAVQRASGPTTGALAPVGGRAREDGACLPQVGHGADGEPVLAVGDPDSDEGLVTGTGGGRFVQSWRPLPGGGAVYVSSARHRDEVYDLWWVPTDRRMGPSGAVAGTPAGSSGFGRPRHRLLARNVHPVLWVDPASGTVLFSRYSVTGRRERRLALWAVQPGARRGAERRPVSRDPGQFGRSSAPSAVASDWRPNPAPPVRWCLAAGEGSFYPLGVRDGRWLFLEQRHGQTRVMSVARQPGAPGRPRLEYSWPLAEVPREVALGRADELFYVRAPARGVELVRVKMGHGAGKTAPSGNPDPVIRVFSGRDVIRSPMVGADGRIWFVADLPPSRTPQVMVLEPGTGRVTVLTDLPGGVWDFSLPDVSGRMTVTMLRDGAFHFARVRPSAGYSPLAAAPEPVTVRDLPPIKGRGYRSEYFSSYWQPRLNQDAQGTRIGVFSYRSDRLDRSHLVVSPTWGLRSRELGYSASMMRQIDLIRANLVAYDETAKRSYRSVGYWERSHGVDFSLTWPLDLATSITGGVSQARRVIAKGPDTPGSPQPTVGTEHAAWFGLRHEVLRTEPLTDVLPRKGRTVDAHWRKGLDWVGGDMIFKRFGLRWQEHVPLAPRLVLSLRGQFAEDDKTEELRRPEDLSLGGGEWLRGYPGSVRYGDSLRAFGIHLAAPIGRRYQRLHRWVQNEMLVVEAFWETGDVRLPGRKFDYLSDVGFEVRTKLLFLRRFPLILRWGMAWPQQAGYGDRRSYFAFSTPSIDSLLD